MDPPANIPTPHSPIHNDSSSSAVATAAAALSQDSSSLSKEDESTETNGNGKRRRSSYTPGSRGVANLTPDQLAKKRANDREAQRAIRERTRSHIVTLETRIKELESQQPFQELQKVAQERDRALAECEMLRKKLAEVASVVGSAHQTQTASQQQQQPNLHGTFDFFDAFVDLRPLTPSETELAALTAQQSPLPPLNTQQPSPQYPPQGSAQSQAYEQGHLHPELRSPNNGANNASPVHHQAAAASGMSYQADNASLRKWSPSMGPPTSHPASPHGLEFGARLPPPAAILDQPNGERLGLNYVLDPKQHQVTTVPSAQELPAFAQPGNDKPSYERLPKNSQATCMLDSILLDFVSNRQAQAASGVDMREVAGPDYPYFLAMKDPSAVHSSKCHPITGVLVDSISKYPGISALQEKVATLYVMWSILRWEICPCEACYQRMPEWVRPMQEHLEVEHAAWHDHVPWPIIRQRLLAHREVSLEDFFIPCTQDMCVNWPYPIDQILVSAQDPEDPEALNMNPVFESHIRNLENWSLGTGFKTTFPYLVDESVRIQDLSRD